MTWNPLSAAKGRREDASQRQQRPAVVLAWARGLGVPPGRRARAGGARRGGRQRHFGTGAFSMKNRPGAFGFGANLPYGKHEVGTEIDVVMSVNLHKHVSLQGGYSFIWGGDVWEAKKADGGRSDADGEFGYLQLALKY